MEENHLPICPISRADILRAEEILGHIEDHSKSISQEEDRYAYFTILKDSQKGY